METAEVMKSNQPYAEGDRRTLFRYAALTVALVVPLLFSFISIRDLYPFAASKMMLWNRDGQTGQDYYVLRGETVSGETIDLPPIKLTNALTGRNWSLVNAAVKNQSLKIRFPHPDNLRRLCAVRTRAHARASERGNCEAKDASPPHGRRPTTC